MSVRVAHMKPTMAVTLTVEKRNSASPYPLIPNKFIPMIVRRNIVTKIALGSDAFQYWIVRAPAIISRGRAKSHCKA